MSLPGKNHRKGRAVKAAIVEQAGRTAVYGDFKEPVPSIGENHIAVTAAALSPVVRPEPRELTTVHLVISPLGWA
jgi:hypothetical protein